MGKSKKKARSAKAKRSNKKRTTKKPVPKKAKVKKKTRRDEARFPGLEKRFFSKAKQEAHDIDYAHLLNEKEKKFLNSFMEETLGARFNHPYKKLIKSKKAKREVYGANNARNRDIMSIHTKTPDDPRMFLESEFPESIEDELIDYIDSKKEQDY